MVQPPKLFGLYLLALLFFLSICNDLQAGLQADLQAKLHSSQTEIPQPSWLMSLPTSHLSWALFAAKPANLVAKSNEFSPLKKRTTRSIHAELSSSEATSHILKPKYHITLKPQLKQTINTSAAKPKIIARYSAQGTSDQLTLAKDKVYHYQKLNGSAAFSDEPPRGGEYQILLFECFACRLDSNLDWHTIPLFSLDYSHSVARAAKTYRLEPALIRAVIHAESAFDAYARSKAGAMGLMQLMPTTAADMGVLNPFNAQQNILGGSRYLAQMLKQFNGDIELACAAYNAGPTTVAQYRGIPPYPETQAYVKRVKILLQRYRNASAS